MSDSQCAGLMLRGESYAGGKNVYHFEAAVRSLCGYRYVVSTHRERAAEQVLCASVVKPGMCVPNNMHFDTTRANIEHRGARRSIS